MKLFLDTNILFDFAFPESPHHSMAKELIYRAPELGYELSSSPYAYLTAFYSLRKHLGERETAQFLFLLSQRVIIENAQVHATIPQHLQKIAIEGKGDVEDLYQQEIARAIGAKAIITRDVQFIQQCKESGIPAYSADTFLAAEGGAK